MMILLIISVIIIIYQYKIIRLENQQSSWRRQFVIEQLKKQPLGQLNRDIIIRQHNKY